MELDSGQCVAELEVGDVLVALNVEGYVRVVFDEQTYKCASQMPKELIDLFHNGGEEYEKAIESGRLYIDDNNWFETFVYYKNPSYDETDKNSVKWLCDQAWCDVVDGAWGENNVEVDVFGFMLDVYDMYEKAQSEQ